MTRDSKGNSKKQARFIRVCPHMLTCPAGLSLTPHELAGLIRVMDLYKGDNNGRLYMSARDLGRQCHMSKDTAARVLRALVDKGFLEITTPGGFSTNGGRATCYEITCFPIRKGKPPKRTYQDWRPYDLKNILVLNQGHCSPKLGSPCHKSGSQ